MQYKTVSFQRYHWKTQFFSYDIIDTNLQLLVNSSVQLRYIQEERYEVSVL